MYGIQRSLYVCLLAVGIGTFLGLLVGTAAGFRRGRTDSVLMRLCDLMLTVPPLVVLLVVASSVPWARNATGFALVLGLVFGWPGLARLIRAEVLSQRERDFVLAAHAMGATDTRIIVKHLLPNMFGSIIVSMTLSAVGTILAEAAISYLGYGLAAGDASLGRLVAEGVAAANTRPWMFYFPGLTLMVLVMCINLIGDGVRDAMDTGYSRRA